MEYCRPRYSSAAGAVIVITNSIRPEPELAQEDANVDGAYASSNTRGLTVMRARLRRLRAALPRL
jgi:hypothetical protein